MHRHASPLLPNALLAGGGLEFFLPHTADFPDGKRTDGRNLMNEATTRYGFKTALHSRSGFDSLKERPATDALPAIGLFANGIAARNHRIH